MCTAIPGLGADLSLTWLDGKCCRVYCRVRPILGFEKDKGQQFAVNLPDELTISHLWRDEKKPREYTFDTVRRVLCALPMRSMRDECARGVHHQGCGGAVAAHGWSI